METLFLLIKKTRAKKFKIRMFYHLQNLFWGAFVRGGFGLGGFCPGGFVGGLCPGGFVQGFLSCHHSIHWFRRFFTFHWICLPFVLLILVGVELPLCVIVTLSQNAVSCFLESSWLWDCLIYFNSVHIICESTLAVILNLVGFRHRAP